MSTQQNAQQKKLPPSPQLVPELGREKRFRIVKRPEADLLHVACNACGHEFLVRERQDNYFFTCLVCRTTGNLPGLLAHEIDQTPDDKLPELQFGGKDRTASLMQIKNKYPYPKTATVVAPPRKG